MTARPIKKIYIELTNRCNLRCAFCPPVRREAGAMTPAQFQLVLEKLSSTPGHLYFHLMGEPTLHPNFAEFLRAAAAAHRTVNLTTNGTALSRIPFDAPALRQVNISLHCLFENKGLDRESYLSELLAFLRGSRATISLRLWSGAAAEREVVLAFLRAHFPLSETSRGYQLSERCFLNLAEPFIWPAEGKATSSTGFCRGLRDQFGILWDGRVVPCCLDSEGELTLGNIFEEDISSILDGERAAQIYRGFSEGRVVEGLCRRCEYRQRFDG